MLGNKIPTNAHVHHVKTSPEHRRQMGVECTTTQDAFPLLNENELMLYHRLQVGSMLLRVL